MIFHINVWRFYVSQNHIKDAQWIMPSIDTDSAIFRKTFTYEGTGQAVITSQAWDISCFI
jgi:hypothetical protein